MSLDKTSLLLAIVVQFEIGLSDLKPKLDGLQYPSNISESCSQPDLPREEIAGGCEVDYEGTQILER